jgi:hypothetical protein
MWWISWKWRAAFWKHDMSQELSSLIVVSM